MERAKAGQVMTQRTYAVSPRRRQRQGGQEMIEFALMAIVYAPLLLGTFMLGMNMIKTIQAKNAIRDMADMLIHGADFSDGGYQTLAKELTTGLNLVSPTYSAGTQTRDDVGTTGDGIVWLSKVMWVGTGANANNFVFAQRVRIGNTNLITAQHASLLGNPGAVTYASDGSVNNYRTDTNAVLAAGPAAAMGSVWITPPSPRTPLVDGQFVYVAEGYFQTPQLSMGSVYGSQGVFSRYFF